MKLIVLKRDPGQLLASLKLMELNYTIPFLSFNF